MMVRMILSSFYRKSTASLMGPETVVQGLFPSMKKKAIAVKPDAAGDIFWARGCKLRPNKMIRTPALCGLTPGHASDIKKDSGIRDTAIMEETETSLYLQQWNGGDQHGLDALLERHLPWIHSQVEQRLTALLRGKGDTFDYVQDAVIQFLRFGPRFNLSNGNHFRALLLRIVESTLLNKYDWFMARRREVARERPLPSDTVLSLDPPDGAVSTPSRIADRNEREAWIRLGMELLSPKDREMIVLRQWDSLPFAEIGDRLGISEDAARKRHNRVVDRLSDKIWTLRCGELNSILEKTPS
jgi:RNA polymerase sigma factor (sigma-70 family)